MGLFTKRRREPTIHEKINFKMVQLLDFYTITRMPRLRKYIPSNLKGKARYNTCYDMPKPEIPLSMVNDYISQKSERVRNYLSNNLTQGKYLRVDITPTEIGFRNSFSVVDKKPSDYKDLERTGAVKFIESSKVRVR